MQSLDDVVSLPSLHATWWPACLPAPPACVACYPACLPCLWLPSATVCLLGSPQPALGLPASPPPPPPATHTHHTPSSTHAHPNVLPQVTWKGWKNAIGRNVHAWRRRHHHGKGK